MKKLPNIIFVQLDGEGKDEWFYTEQKADDLKDGVIGVYKLTKTVKKRTETILE